MEMNNDSPRKEHRMSIFSRVQHFCEHFCERGEQKIVPGCVTLKPVIFHREHGRNIRLGFNGHIAYRAYDFCNGYVFMPKPSNGNESLVVVQILEIDHTYLGSLAFGVTSRDPTNSRPNTFPPNPRELDDGYSYLVRSDIAKSSKEGAILIFYLNEKNEMNVIVNEEPEEKLFSVPQNTFYWWFFDLYGSTRKIRVYVADESEIDKLRSLAHESNTSLDMRTSEEEPSLKLNCYVTTEKVWFKPLRTNSLPMEDPLTGYCIECLENPCNNCMLYPCGDLVLCYGCATKLKRKHGYCPKCHSAITDVTRLFRQ